MKIETSKGKSLEIRMITAMNGGENVMLVIADDRPMSEIAADLEGCNTLTKTDANKQNVKEVYEGYTRIVSMQREKYSGMMRVILGNA